MSEQENIKETNNEVTGFINPYELFKINEESSIKDLKKSYYDLCLIAHPDKGGNLKDMQVIQNAYIFLKKQIVNHTKEEIIELMKNANYDFKDYYTQFKIEKVPSLLDITHGEYLESFNKLFDIQSNYITYNKLGYNTEISKINNTNNKSIVQNIEYDDVLKNELGEEYLNNINNINSEENKKNKNEDDVNKIYNNISNNYEKKESEMSIVIASNTSYGNYYNFDIERDIKKYSYKDLQNFSKNKKLIEELNIDYGSSNYGDYYKVWENNNMYDVINSKDEHDKKINEKEVLFKELTSSINKCNNDEK